MSARAIPSSRLSLAEVLRSGVRLHLYRDRLSRLGWVVTVVRAGPAEVELRLDPGDLAQAGLTAGARVVLGFGAAQPAMLYVSEVAVQDVGVDRLVVSYPAPPRKGPRRGYARADLTWPCALGRRGAVVLSETVNVSASGALVRWSSTEATAGEEPPALGDVVELTLEVPARDPLRVSARVVRHAREAGPPGAVSGVAVRFLDVPEVEEMRLQLLVLRGIARRYVRVGVSRPCRLTLGTRALEGTTDNVSGSGMLLRVPGSEAPIELGERGALVAWLDEAAGAPPVELEVSVVRLAADGDARLVGVDFAGASRAVRSRIVEVIMGALRRV